MNIYNEYVEKGYKYIACIDEVGRGCLCGDVVACAIIMDMTDILEEVTDSKKLSEKKREELYDKILDKSIAVGIGQVDSSTIDKINIKQATRLAMKKAVLNLKDKNERPVRPDFLLIDAENIDLDIDQESLIKGDQKSYGIACASIIAKVYRDCMCKKLALTYPGYKLEKNKGYGTKEHREAIIKLGPTKIHRKTFLKNILK